jgi:hypothetical protein
VFVATEYTLIEGPVANLVATTHGGGFSLSIDNPGDSFDLAQVTHEQLTEIGLKCLESVLFNIGLDDWDAFKKQLHARIDDL